MSLKIEHKAEEGLTQIVGPGGGQLRLLSFSLLLLSQGHGFEFARLGEERVLLLMRGQCHARVGGERFGPLARSNLFKERATAVYVPPDSPCYVEADLETEIAVVSAPAEIGSQPRVVLPADVIVRRVGASNWFREVHDIVGFRISAQKLLVGETFNPPGNWSSFPPHKHERNDPPQESSHEEIYHFRLNPPSGFGLQLIYTDDREVDEPIVVRDADTVVIPRGYHPVVAAPGYSLYYLWALAGESRQLFTREDPAHSWVRGNRA